VPGCWRAWSPRPVDVDAVTTKWAVTTVPIWREGDFGGSSNCYSEGPPQGVGSQLSGLLAGQPAGGRWYAPPSPGVISGESIHVQAAHGGIPSATVIIPLDADKIR